MNKRNQSVSNERGYTVIELLICVGMVATLVVAGALVYAAAHFVVKWW